MTHLNVASTIILTGSEVYGGTTVLTPLSDDALAQTWIFVGSAATGLVSRYALTTDGILVEEQATALPMSQTVFRIADMEIVGHASPHVLISGVEETKLFSISVDDITTWSSPTSLSSQLLGPVTQMEALEIGGQNFIATGSRDTPGMVIYQWQEDRLTPHVSLEDQLKTALGDIADVQRLSIDGADYLVVGSVTESAISTFRFGDNGSPELIDTLGIKDGLWVSGLDSLATVSAHGHSYVGVAGMLSSSLTLVRVNSGGVMFVEDHVLDSLDTRFSRVDAMAGFEIGDRGFLVAGGADDGLTLFEVLPDHRLLARSSLVQTAEDALENITSIEAVNSTTAVHLIAAGAPGLTVAALDKMQLGTPQMGTPGDDSLVGGLTDDLIWGRSGDDILVGGSGADILAGGPGRDHLTGGEGSDVFIFSADTDRDVILDFELGVDRIDITAWGRIYDHSALTIDNRWDGADVSFGAYSLRLSSVTPVRLTADDFSNDMFVF